MLLSGKLNKIRTFAMLLIFIGVGVMYLGFVFKSLMVLFFILGMLFVLASVGIYFWIGILSTHSVGSFVLLAINKRKSWEKKTNVCTVKPSCLWIRRMLQTLHLPDHPKGVWRSERKESSPGRPETPWDHLY